MTDGSATTTAAAAECRFEPLPIDGDAGFPQEFAFAFRGVTYHFRLHVNLPFGWLAAPADPGVIHDFAEPGSPPSEAQPLFVVRVEEEVPSGGRRIMFLRRVFPATVYATGSALLRFPVIRVADRNLGGRGAYGTCVRGEITPRCQ